MSSRDVTISSRDVTISSRDVIASPRDDADDNLSLFQLFHVFYCFMKGGIAERQQLLKLGVHKRFMRILLEEGNFVFYNYPRLSLINPFSVIWSLI